MVFTLVAAMLFLWPGIAAAGMSIYLGVQSGSHSSTHFGIDVSHGWHGKHGRHYYRHYGFGKPLHFRGQRHGHGYRPYYRPHYSYSYRYYYGYPRYYHYGRIYQVGHAGYGYLQTDITPEHAEVYIDGRYYGTAAEFNGSGRYEDMAEGRIALTPGIHRVELRAPGYEDYTKNVEVSSDRTIVIIHDLERY